jgi:DNA modification methylase
MAKKKTQSITWTNERRKLADLIPWEHNPRTIKQKQAERLVDSVETFGQVETLAIGPQNELYNGHQRLSVLAGQYGMDYEVDVRVASRELTERERQQLTVYLHRGAAGDWEPTTLFENFDINDLTAWGFNTDELDEMFADFKLEPEAGAGTDTEAQVNKADELRQKWGVELGQLWQLGDHHIICGDCTDPATVARLMGGEKAVLCHADPPYGMGKEKDGIANDNLYREKLDAFQMAWWRAARPHIEDNGSAYIWGNAEDLWRLWYVGGLKDSERLTLRNEIVWDKGHGQGMSSEDFRSYAPATERCLFFMLGEQGFNNNADNYWEGWDSIVDYLDTQRQLMGWGIKDTKRIAGHSEKSGCHWFDKSQWSMPTEETYNAWRNAASGNAFKREYNAFKREYDDLKREYDDLKREFYATRAYFDNAHDNMTDVWDFPRVTGDDRHGHATPKPVTMIERAIKSSCSTGGVVYVPFGGTAPEIVACQNLNRKCRAVEISPGYTSVAIERFFQHTGIAPVLMD